MPQAMQNKSLTKYCATPGSKQPELPQSRVGTSTATELGKFEQKHPKQNQHGLDEFTKTHPQVLPRTVHIDLDPTQHGRMPCHFGINSGDDAKRGEIPNKAKIGHKEGGQEGNKER